MQKLFDLIPEKSKKQFIEDVQRIKNNKQQYKLLSQEQKNELSMLYPGGMEWLYLDNYLQFKSLSKENQDFILKIYGGNLNKIKRTINSVQQEDRLKYLTTNVDPVIMNFFISPFENMKEREAEEIEREKERERKKDDYNKRVSQYKQQNPNSPIFLPENIYHLHSFIELSDEDRQEFLESGYDMYFLENFIKMKQLPKIFQEEIKNDKSSILFHWATSFQLDEGKRIFFDGEYEKMLIQYKQLKQYNQQLVSQNQYLMDQIAYMKQLNENIQLDFNQ